ncbi:MAG: DinB family protein, partial [Chloroflexota bacterium]
HKHYNTHIISHNLVVWLARLTSIRDENEPRWAWTEPGPEPGLDDTPLDDLLGRLAEARARTVGILEGFDEATWSRTGVHATYGRLDVAALVAIAVDHDEEHLRALIPTPTT